MKKHRIFDIVVTVVILVMIGILVWASVQKLLSSSKQDDSQMMVQQALPEKAAVAVSVAEAQRETLYKTTRLYGRLFYDDAVNVYPSIAGKIVQYQVAKGQRVEIGQTVAMVDASKPGAAYSPSPVVAPVSGIVYSIDSVIGETVSTTSVLATIQSSDKLQIRLDLPERYLSSIQEGMSAKFTTVPWPDAVFMATVENIGLTVDSTSQSVEVVLMVDPVDSRLKSGMFVTVDLVTSQATDAVTVPLSSIGTYLDGQVVYVVDESDTVARRSVVVGLSNDTKAAIADGLDIGERVVTAGSVTDGTHVTIASDMKEEIL